MSVFGLTAGASARPGPRPGPFVFAKAAVG